MYYPVTNFIFAGAKSSNIVDYWKQRFQTGEFLHIFFSEKKGRKLCTIFDTFCKAKNTPGNFFLTPDSGAKLSYIVCYWRFGPFWSRKNEFFFPKKSPFLGPRGGPDFGPFFENSSRVCYSVILAQQFNTLYWIQVFLLLFFQWIHVFISIA